MAGGPAAAVSRVELFLPVESSYNQSQAYALLDARRAL